MNERERWLLRLAITRLRPLCQKMIADGWRPEVIVFTGEEIPRIPGYKVALVVPLDSVEERDG